MNLVFDIGGTNMRLATATDGQLGQITKVRTPLEYDAMMDQLTQMAEELAPEGISAGAGCVAAQINAEKGLYDANNRPLWNGKHLDSDLTARFSAPISVHNDCDVIALAEAVRGGGRGFSRVAYITVSTGVGAGYVVDGVMQSVDGFFFGHVGIDGKEIENLISGTAVRKKFGIEPKDLDSIEEREKLAEYLARGLPALISRWNPECIVFGGSMIVGINPIPLEHVAQMVQRLTPQYADIASRMAELRDEGGLIGGAILAERSERTNQHDIR